MRQIYMEHLPLKDAERIEEQFKHLHPLTNEVTALERACQMSDWCEPRAKHIVEQWLIYSTKTHRLSVFGHDAHEVPQRSLIHDIIPGVQIFASQVRPNTYIFFREDEQFDSMASVLYPWVGGVDPNHELPWLEVREIGASLNDPPIAAFAHGEFELNGSCIQDIELKLQGHIIRPNYHTWDCNCPWCNDVEPSETDERGPAWAYWETSPDTPGPILAVYLVDDKDWVIRAGVGVERIRAIEPITKEARLFTRLTFPPGTKLALNGGCPCLQTPGGWEICHEISQYRDPVEGSLTGSSRVLKTKQWDCYWSDSINRNEQRQVPIVSIEGGSEHPF